jgi:hypothetical protein
MPPGFLATTTRFAHDDAMQIGPNDMDAAERCLGCQHVWSQLFWPYRPLDCPRAWPGKFNSRPTPPSRQEWRLRVEDTRQRSEEFVARARAGTMEPLQDIENEKRPRIGAL